MKTIKITLAEKMAQNVAEATTNRMAQRGNSKLPYDMPFENREHNALKILMKDVFEFENAKNRAEISADYMARDAKTSKK